MLVWVSLMKIPVLHMLGTMLTLFFAKEEHKFGSFVLSSDDYHDLMMKILPKAVFDSCQN